MKKTIVLGSTAAVAIGVASVFAVQSAVSTAAVLPNQPDHVVAQGVTDTVDELEAIAAAEEEARRAAEEAARLAAEEEARRAAAAQEEAAAAARQQASAAPSQPSTSGPTQDYGIADSAYTGAYYNAAYENTRKCIVRKESGGNYGIVSSNGLYHGAYQFSRSTGDATARMMGRGDLVGTPVSSWSRYDQDTAFWTLWNNGAGRGHWPTAAGC